MDKPKIDLLGEFFYTKLTKNLILNDIARDIFPEAKANY